LEPNELKEKHDTIPDWKRHELENRHKTSEQKRQDQVEQLVETLQTLQTLFQPIFLPALKHIEGIAITEREQQCLLAVKDTDVLRKRLTGLRSVFEDDYYHALDRVVGEKVIPRQAVVPEEKSEQEEALERVMAAGNQSSRLPKGFSKWNLKQIKINESLPEAHDNKWVEFWSLKGQNAVGRILYNEERDVHYFRPHGESALTTFPLTRDQGRKLTREGRNYYFRRATSPPGEI
jgi:hypothetical protein